VELKKPKTQAERYAELPRHNYTRLRCLHCDNYIDIPIYCGNRFCKICSKSRLCRVRERLKILVKSTTLVRGQSYKHLTLTISSQPDLPEMVKFLIASFRRLRQSKLWRRLVSGGAFVIEVTRGVTGAYHAHIHAVIQSFFIPYVDLLKAWSLASRGSTGVYIQPIPIDQIVKYLTKYLSKQCEVPDPDEREMMGRTLGRFRLFQPFGSWHGIKTVLEKPPYVCPCCGHTGYWALEQQHDGRPWEISNDEWMRKAGFR